MSETNGRVPALSPEHEPLRADVGYLGALLGEVLREQGGEPLFAAVETARVAAIRRRETDAPFDELRLLLDGLPAGDAAGLTRAFSSYFSLTNLAEQVHRIRRRLDYLRAGTPQPGSLAAVSRALANRPPERIAAALSRLTIMPVFTAHPTEATRRTILKKEQRIARALVDRIEHVRRSPAEDARITERIRGEITRIWQTSGESPLTPAVADEVEHVLFFLTDVVYRVVPAFVDELEEAAGPDRAHRLPRPVLRFGSWVGGDMDGNPNVGAQTIRATLSRQRRLILRRYRTEIQDLFEHLSQSESRVTISEPILARRREYERRFPEAARDIPTRYADMPYRMLLWLIWHRLGLTETGSAGGYGAASELLEDLDLIQASLAANRGERGGRRLVLRLLRRVETFGFHLATLDLRQDARRHREVLALLLDDPQLPHRSPEDRTAAVAEALPEIDGRAGVGTVDAEETLDVFRAVGEAQRTHGARAIGPFIVSMAQGPDDVLNVLALARAAGLADPGSPVPLDVAPLFETVDDLENAHATVDAMLTHAGYREHLRSRGNRQIVMLGYSDSAKISGIGASRWALYCAQERLADAASRHGIELELFHGRGGTVARGGSKPRAAILASPPGTASGRLRVTEQGEIINAKFGLRGIAERTLELTAGAVLEAAVVDAEHAPPEAEWRAAMNVLAEASRSRWTRLVREDPRFLPYFRAATPVDVIERMALGSRPASRRADGGIESLRAIPWVFAWSQNRHTLPAWYGLEAGFAAAESAIGIAPLRRMAAAWPFFSNLLADASMALAKADMDIGSVYADLAEEGVRSLFGEIRESFRETRDRILRIREETVLLEREPLLREIIRLRNPYVDPMSLIQIDLLRRWRETGRMDGELEHALYDTVRGIARGLRNTG